ncbi:disease resistance protein RPV1 isoform X2 [Helianthus annuus]|uniref:disease resistance protein RPV1 isoform X2 n=1 Tax=Helianthus annuus TaxID=4232 RepID=UPI0016530402|nr:disease resistance protein RPV1 isoform X2 [Helianthus annuus]
MASTPTIRYDVFLSFPGEDTRHAYTDHLYHALIGAGLRTFRDNDEIDRGQQLKPEIETAITESRASIVVLSQNYANSIWCLDELCLILDQKRKLNHFVLPVFYHVNPSDFRKQSRNLAIEGSIWIALIRVANLTGFLNCLACLGIDGSKWTEVNVRRWKKALAEVANLTGMILTGSETNFIAEVVKTVQGKLDLKQLSTPAHLTGMEARVGVINSWLRDEQCNAIAICGMGGSGKTTLAQYFYNLNKQDFQSTSFVQEIGNQPDRLLRLQKQLLKDLLGGKKIRISSVSEGTHKIMDILQMKRVLVVLDDIDSHEQLNALFGTKTFPTQSKIIITTRLLDIHAWFRSISWRCWVHELNLLNDVESLELLSWHAFGSRIPMEGFEDLASQLAQYCGGNPLALKVLGSSLFVSDDDSWTRNNMREVWESRMNSLKSMKGDLDCNIQGVLQKSFDCLPLSSHRELFLHVACFFVDEDKNVMEMILEDELYAKSGILTLTHRCLLTISADDKLMMHQLLQEMGKRIVCEESKDPAKRSRVWRDAESYHVLRKGNGSDIIQALALDMRNVEQMTGPETLALKTSSLENMDKLKLLFLKYVNLFGSYDKFPELTWLGWHGCPLQTIPPGLLKSSLVAIDMSYGHMETFEAPTVLKSLKYLSLKGCDKLVRICNLCLLPKLELLNLTNCSSLTHISKSIGDLESLVTLDLKGCIKMWKCVHRLETMIIPEERWFSLPKSLMWLFLTNCDLEFNSDIRVPFHAHSSLRMSLAYNPFEYLPNNIDLKMLRSLNLYSCQNLKSLPSIPSTLKELYIDWCTSLERLTFQSGRFSLREFAYECCFKLSEVQGLFKLLPVVKMEAADLGDMQWVKAYEDHKVDLVGDEITKGRIWNTQMLYEYGIMSTYLQGVKDKIMATYKSLGVYKVPFLFAKISNRTKGLTWVYNPMVYCKSKVDEDVVWLSYWPIGNILDAGDEVNVVIYVEKGTMMVCECGANLVYMDDGEVQEEENCENSTRKGEEVIGGDLSEFEVTTGGYYLCRRDLFGLETSSWLKWLFGDNVVHYTNSQGWRKALQSAQSRELRYYVNTFLKVIELRVGFNSENAMDKIEKAVYSLVGVESVSAHTEMGKLIVTGYVDPIAVVTCVREFDNMVEIVSFKSIFS